MTDRLNIALVAPARWIEPEIIAKFSDIITPEGCSITGNDQIHERHGQLAGSDRERATSLMAALEGDHNQVVWAARGGYGAMRILKYLNKTDTNSLLIGYSDICSLHFGALGDNLTAIHGAMPIDIASGKSGNIISALNMARKYLNGGVLNERAYEIGSVSKGDVDAPCYVSNLSVLTSLIGTDCEPELPPCILILEDVGEYYYALDRMFWRLSRSRLNQSIKAIVLGDFSELEDNDVPWGQSVMDITRNHFEDIPIAYGMPVGHGQKNEPILQGERAMLSIGSNGAQIVLSGVKNINGKS